MKTKRQKKISEPHHLLSAEVTSQNPESTYEALKTYGTDLTSMAREGKLDPVIGRDDEIRRVTLQMIDDCGCDIVSVCVSHLHF